MQLKQSSNKVSSDRDIFPPSQTCMFCDVINEWYLKCSGWSRVPKWEPRNSKTRAPNDEYRGYCPINIGNKILALSFRHSDLDPRCPQTYVVKISTTPTQTIFPSIRYCWWNAPWPGTSSSPVRESIKGSSRKIRDELQRNRVNCWGLHFLGESWWTLTWYLR